MAVQQHQLIIGGCRQAACSGAVFEVLAPAAGLADVRDANPDALALAGHEHDFVRFRHRDGADDFAGLGGAFHRDDAFAAAILSSVVFEGGPLADAVFADDHQGALGVDG